MTSRVDEIRKCDACDGTGLFQGGRATLQKPVCQQCRGTGLDTLAITPSPDENATTDSDADLPTAADVRGILGDSALAPSPGEWESWPEVQRLRKAGVCLHIAVAATVANDVQVRIENALRQFAGRLAAETARADAARQSALEEAAKVAEDAADGWSKFGDSDGETGQAACREIASTLRALAKQEGE